MTDEIQEAEVVEATAIVQAQPPPQTGLANLHGTNDPAEMIERATAQADALAEVVNSRELYSMIRGKKHVTVEGWTTLGAMVGVFPVLVRVTELATPEGFVIRMKKGKGQNAQWTTEKMKPGRTFGFVALVEARTLGGQTVGSAESECTREEYVWATRDDHALRSMAQTRATSKALRLPLGFIMQLAGFNPTPEEEMPGGGAKIPNVPGDLIHYPSDVEGYEQSPTVWAKKVTLILTGGDKEKATASWAGSIEIVRPETATDLTIGEAEGIVDNVRMRIDDAVAEADTLFDDGPGYG